MQGLRNDKGDIVTLQVLLNDNILIKVLSGGGGAIRVRRLAKSRSKNDKNFGSATLVG